MRPAHRLCCLPTCCARVSLGQCLPAHVCVWHGSNLISCAKKRRPRSDWPPVELCKLPCPACPTRPVAVFVNVSASSFARGMCLGICYRSVCQSGSSFPLPVRTLQETSLGSCQRQPAERESGKPLREATHLWRSCQNG